MVSGLAQWPMKGTGGLPNREGLGTKRKINYLLPTTLGGVQCRWNGETSLDRDIAPYTDPRISQMLASQRPTPACSSGAELHSGHCSATAQTPATEEYKSCHSGTLLLLPCKVHCTLLATGLPLPVQPADAASCHDTTDTSPCSTHPGMVEQLLTNMAFGV